MAVYSIAALKAELNLAASPLFSQYQTALNAGNDAAVAGLINAASGAGSGSAFRNDVAPREIIQAIASADFAAAVALQIAKLTLILQAAPIDCTLANVRGSLQGIFSGASAGTIAALTAVVSKTGSRAEVLWGAGTVVPWQDVTAARV